MDKGKVDFKKALQFETRYNIMKQICNKVK